ncbi:MAG TPA: hypothetical protein VJ044_10385, partial [Candidatus Hodarchaeales archaeon]|nr:hypothetical protein [Candidatus Hodarchaeales archaeon]
MVFFGIILADINITSANLYPLTNVSFGSSYDLILNMTNVHTSQPIDGMGYSADSSSVSITDLTGGSYNVTYLRALTSIFGLESINITFSKPFLNPRSLVWNVNITEPLQPFPTTLSSFSGANVSAEWFTNASVVLLLRDDLHKININASATEFNFTNSSRTSMILNGVFNGNHSFFVTPLTIGTWIANVTVWTDTWSSYFLPASMPLVVSGSKRSTASNFTISPSSSNQTIYVNYQLSTIVNITWKDSLTGAIANSSDRIINSFLWGNFNGYSNGVHQFIIFGRNTTGFVLQITFVSDYYSNRTVTLNIRVNIFSSSISVNLTNGILNGTINTSKLGYTVAGFLDWGFLYNGSAVLDPEANLFLNGDEIEDLEARGIKIQRFSQGLASAHSAYFEAVLLPMYNYSVGKYNITIEFSKEGVESAAISFALDVKGFDILVEFIYEPTITPGSSYFIIANLTYVNGTTEAVLNDFRLLSGFLGRYYLLSAGTISQFPGFGKPVVGVSVFFNVTLSYQGGNIRSFTGSVPSNTNGTATYILSSSDTANVIKIASLSVSVTGDSLLSGTSVNDEAISEKVVPRIITSTIPEEIVLVALVLVILTIILGIVLVGFMVVRSRHQNQAITFKAKETNFEQLLEALVNTFAILLTDSNGLPLRSY